MYAQQPEPGTPVYPRRAADPAVWTLPALTELQP